MPVNYQMDVINPFEAALKGYGAGAQMLQQERTAERQVRQDEQQGQLFGLQMQEAQLRAQKAQAEMADAEAMKTVYGEYADIMRQVRENNDPSLIVSSGIIDRLAPINENLAKYAQGQFTQMDDAKKLVAHKNVMGLAVAGMMGNWDVMTAQLQTQRDAYAESGDEEQVKLLDGMIAQSKDPKMREVVADTFLARAIDLNPKATGEQLDTLSKGIQLPLDQELTRAQINREKAAARLDARRLEIEAMTGGKVQSSTIIPDGDGTAIMIMSDGTRRVLDPQGRLVEGEAAQQAIANANRVAVATTSEKAGGRRGASIGQDVAKDAMVSAGKMRSNITNLDQVVAAIDKGAETGLLESMVPAWNAATVELRQLQNQLGLDVIGSVTFGALSEGELNLALQTALPTNLRPTELRAWVLKKKAAQQKLATYMENQARYLSIPGTNVGSWLAHLETMNGTIGAAPSNRTPAANAPGGRTIDFNELP